MTTFRALSSLLRSHRPAALAALALAPTFLAAAAAGCAGGGLATGQSTTLEPEGTGGASTTTTPSAGGAGGASATTTTNAGGAGGASTTTTTTTDTGTGGAGGAPFVWPDCAAQPPGVDVKTLPEVWAMDPAMQGAPVWVPGVYVTAISGSGCVAGTECQIFLQQDESYADLAAAAHHAIKLFASKAASQHFTNVKVGDKLDVLGSPWRSTLNGANELELDVNLKFPGCAKATGTGSPTPVPATLADLTIDAYENTLGPVLVEVDTVSGKPTANDQIFGLWPTGQFPDGGADAFVSLSFYFLQGQAFSGLTLNKLHDFTKITGVFGEVLQPGPTKFRVLYPRDMSEVVVGKVH